MNFTVAKYVLGLWIASQLGSQCFAQNGIFVQFAGLTCQGASDPHFPGSAVSSISFGGSKTIGSPSGSPADRESAAPVLSDLKLVKPLDDCTPLLFQETVSGEGRTVTITVTTTSNTGTTALVVIQLTNTLISSDQFSDGAGGRPSEMVSLNYTKIRITHVPSGKSFCFDLAILGACS